MTMHLIRFAIESPQVNLKVRADTVRSAVLESFLSGNTVMSLVPTPPGVDGPAGITDSVPACGGS